MFAHPICESRPCLFTDVPDMSLIRTSGTRDRMKLSFSHLQGGTAIATKWLVSRRGVIGTSQSFPMSCQRLILVSHSRSSSLVKKTTKHKRSTFFCTSKQAKTTENSRFILHSPVICLVILYSICCCRTSTIRKSCKLGNPAENKHGKSVIRKMLLTKFAEESPSSAK